MERIIAYLRDKLSNRERHDFEKEMNADPFLSDAMDGFAKLYADELENDLTLLNQQLREKTAPKKKHSIITYLSIAASIAIIISMAVLYFSPADKELNEFQVAQQTTIKPKQEAEIIKADSSKSDKVEEAKFQESVIPQKEYAVTKQENITAKSKIEEPKKVLAKADTKPSKIKVQKITLQEDILEFEIAEEMEEPIATSPTKPQMLSAQNTYSIAGVIKDGESPIPGVSVNIKGTSKGTITDMDGQYQIDAKEGDVLVYSFIGYKQKEEIVTDKLIAKADITLDEDSNGLDEVVVIGYGTQKKKAVTGAVTRIKGKDISQAQNYTPVGGHRKFKRYIKKNKLINRNESLLIEAEISINSLGKVDDVKIITNTDESIKQEVIRLLKNGPDWIAEPDHDSDNNKVIVTISL